MKQTLETLTEDSMMNDMTFDTERAATEQLTAAARAAAQRIATRGRSAIHEAGRRAAALRSRALAQEERARAALAEQTRAAVGYVRRRPLVGVGVALAAGIVLCGLLFKRR
jgi:ElaB/YqjD/DUF883 family membrane-anchored ribosome-binding protein